MAQQPPVMFADAVMSVSLANGVVRITLGALDAENKLEPAGTLVMPLNQLGGTVRNLANATNDLIAKAREAQAKAEPPPEDEAAPESTKLTFPE
jgi:hypothetical protein